jgi:hypothetical protein
MPPEREQQIAIESGGLTMSDLFLYPRMKLTIELALSADRNDVVGRQRQDGDAKKLGLTGAEVDFARRGYSFDVQTSIALELALAAKATDKEAQRKAHARAVRAGIPENVCRAIEDFAETFAMEQAKVSGALKNDPL